VEKDGKRWNLYLPSFIILLFFGSLVNDGILSLGGRKAGINCNLKIEDFLPLFLPLSFTVTNSQQIKITH
jgi:hypothetical protein